MKTVLESNGGLHPESESRICLLIFLLHKYQYELVNIVLIFWQPIIVSLMNEGVVVNANYQGRSLSE